MAGSKILAKGVPQNVGLDGFGRKELEARLWEIFNNENMWWLTAPLLTGLAKQNATVNQRLHFGEYHEPQPILHCGSVSTSSWKHSLVIVGRMIWSLSLLLLGRKCPRNCQIIVQHSPSQVKYSSPRTVELLLDAGIKFYERDCFGQTIWKNAVERPNTGIIEILIDRCNGIIPIAEEKLTVSQISKTGKQTTISLLDHIYAESLFSIILLLR